MYGSKDVVCAPHLVKETKAFIPQLKEVKLEGKGHWLPIEARDDIISEVVELVESAMGSPLPEITDGESKGTVLESALG